MSRFDIDLKEIDAEISILADPLLLDERPVLARFIERLRSARAPAEYRRLQSDLIEAVRGLQDGRDDLRDAKKHAAAEIAKLSAAGDAPRERIIEAQQRLDQLGRRERIANALRHAFLSVGDGIAWKILGFDRAAVTVLARGNRVARFASGVGFDTELSAIEHLWTEQRRFALHNDLTTCLRHGDLTAPRPGDTAIDIYEIKTSRGSRRARQDERIKTALEFINSGRYVGPDGRPARIIRLRRPYRTHLSQLGTLIHQAHRQGFASARPTPCMLLAAVDPYAIRGYDPSERIPELLNRALAKCGWTDLGDRLFIYMSGLRRIRDRKGNSGQLAPFTIFPLDPSDIAGLLLGQLDFVAVLNADLLEASLALRGLRAEVASPPDHSERFMRATAPIANHELTIEVSSTLREQMLLELMTPASLADAITGLIRELHERPGPINERAIVAFADEARAWRAALTQESRVC